MKNLEQIRSIFNIEPYSDNGIPCCMVYVEGFKDASGKTFRLDGYKIDEVLKNDNILLCLHEHFSVVLGDEYLKKIRGFGLNVVHCLSDLEDCSPMQKEAILANCGTKIFLKNEK